MDTRMIDRNINKHIKNWKKSQSWTIESLHGSLMREVNEIKPDMTDALLLSKLEYLSSIEPKNIDFILSEIKFVFSRNFNNQLDSTFCDSLKIDDWGA
jgi:hypothetical protein